MPTTKIDTIRALFTYATATLVVLGGMYQITRTAEGSVTQSIIAGFVASAATFLFVQETATRTARQAAASTLAEKQGSNGHPVAE